MENSRELWESVVAGLAKLSLVLALGVLATFLMLGAAHGNDAGLYYALATTGSDVTASVPHGYGTPHGLGSVLTLVLLAAGLGVLGFGATRPERTDDARSGPRPVAHLS